MVTPVKKKRRAEGRLRRFVQSYLPAAGTLPLVHVTRAYSLDEMLDGDTLDPAYCDVFNEPLIYFFYGRPAYRAKDGNNARLEFEWPIVFIFEPSKIATIKRVYPFDTGAFHHKLYTDFFDKRSELADFELEPSIDGAKKFVSAFYTDHKEYFFGSTRKNVALSSRQFEAQGVHELSRLPGVQDKRSSYKIRDERSSAIEVQVADSIKLSEALAAVILPEPYLDDNAVKEALARWQVPVIETYATLDSLGSEAWVGQIYELVRKLYERMGYLG